MATISVVLLSYNRPQYLRDALASVARQTRSPLEVLVVDNCSPAHEDITRAVADSPGVRLIRNQQNLGFAAGMNTGLRTAAGDYVLLTEDDILLDANALDCLFAYLSSRPDVGLCTGLMLNRADGSVRCAGGELHLGSRYQKRIYGRSDANARSSGEPFEVTFVPGGFLFARRVYLQRLGGFREDFFMYFEDDELCQRVLKGGKRVVVVPACRLHHFEPIPGYTPDWLEGIKARNFLSLYLLHAPARVLPMFALRYGPVDLVRSALRRERRFWHLLEGWVRVLARLPRLLRERHALSKEEAAHQPGAGQHCAKVT